MLKLNYEAVHRFAESFDNASWDGWTLEIFKANPAGYTSKKGVFRNGQWGMINRIAPDDKGIWTFRV